MGPSRAFWSQSVALSTTPAVLLLPDGWSELKLEVDAQSLAQTGPTYAAPAVADVDGVTTLTGFGSATGGTFTLKAFPGTDIEESTATIPYNESAANIKTALAALNAFAAGDVTAAGGALPTAVTLTWTGGVYAATIPPLILGTNSLTGGNNPTIRVVTTTQAAGNGGYGYLTADVPEVWQADRAGNKRDRFLYLAAVSGTATAFVSAFR